MNESTVTGNQSRWMLGFCPFTGDEVVGIGMFSQVPKAKRQASQWYCPACGRWHTRQMDERRNGRAKADKKRA